MFKCQECGRKFKSAAAAERASSQGCPKCGGCDIDLASHRDWAETIIQDRRSKAAAAKRAEQAEFDRLDREYYPPGNWRGSQRDC